MQLSGTQSRLLGYMSTEGKNPRLDPEFFIGTAAISLVGAFIFLRVSVAFSIAFVLTSIIAISWYFWPLISNKFPTAAKKVNENDFGQRVNMRLQSCQEKEHRFRSEAESIRESIAALRDDLERSDKAGTDEKERAGQLIKEFEAEFNLRLAKAAFFADCAAKLRELLDRHRLHESIAARKRELDELRKTNFDDEASLEETRYHLEQDSIQLDTIAELTKDISISFKAEQAEELRAKLEKLRTSL